MSYTPYYSPWKDNESGGTPITAEALNHMERGIQEANDANDEVTTFINNLKAIGVGNGTENAWSSSVNLLNVLGARNGGVWLVKDLPANLGNCPISGTDTFVAYRRQGVYSSTEMLHAFVELIEIAPVPGRHWINHYNKENGNWQGWKRLDNLGNTTQMGSVATTEGLTLAWRLNETMRLLDIQISGTLTADLLISGSYYTVATIPEIATLLTARRLRYIDYNATHRGQLVVNSSGAVQLGYTRLAADNAAAGLMLGQSVYIDELFMLT